MSLEKELIDELIKWAIRGAMALVATISMWVAKSVYTHNTDIVLLKNDIQIIRSDVKDIKDVIIPPRRTR